MSDTSTQFGFRKVEAEAKQGMVRDVFSSVASNYDIMNDLMSAGMHRLWKNEFVRRINVGPNAAVLDLAGDAEHLPVPDQSLDIITIAFGLRNVTNIQQALADAHRALKPGGQFLCLVFSKVTVPPLAKIYDAYSFNVIPKIGEFIAKDRASYQYLVESIRLFPKQEELKRMMEQAGFAKVRYTNLTLGTVAIHQGWRI